MNKDLKNVSRETMYENFQFCNFKIEFLEDDRFLIIYNKVGISFTFQEKNIMLISDSFITFNCDKYIISYSKIHQVLNVSSF